MTSLTGCAGTVYRTQLEVYCPPLYTYSEEFNSELADEIDALPDDFNAIPAVITDYISKRSHPSLRRTEGKTIMSIFGFDSIADMFDGGGKGGSGANYSTGTTKNMCQ